MRRLVLIVAAIGGLFMTASAPAQTASTQNATQALSSVVADAQQVQTQITGFINQIVGFVGQTTSADFAAAIADAQAQNPQNANAIACWQTLAKIVPTQVPAGAGIAYLKQRMLDLIGYYGPINQNCPSVAPGFVKVYDQAVSAMQQLPF